MPEEAQIASPTPTNTPATSVTPGDNGNGTASSGGGQAQGQGAPTQEAFTNIDPNTLPKELRGVYDNMLRDYKGKTTTLADERKKYSEEIKRYSDYDTVKERAQALEQLQSDPRFQSWVQQLNQQNGNAKAEEGLSPELQQLWLEGQADPAKAVEFHRKIAQMETASLRSEQEKLKTENLNNQAEGILKAWSEAKDSKTGEPLRKDYDRLEKSGLFEFAVSKYLDKYPNTQVDEGMKVLNAAYETSKKTYEEIFQEGYQAHLREAQQKVSNSSERPGVGANSNEENLDYDKAKNLSVRDAVALARQGKRLAKTF